MAETRQKWSGSEDGTTLTELLVVIAILSVIGTITTIGVVTGFRAQADATAVAETLDGTRLATQRVRDFVRGADEVCANSTPEQLVLWTDDDGDGSVDDGELDIFEIAVVAGEEVFQRRVPLASGEEVQLIRDDIINDLLFNYNGNDPAAQPADLACTEGVTPSGSGNRTQTVSVEFTVQNPADPTDPVLTTSTTVRIRNAGLESPDENEPVAAFDVTCSTDSGSSVCVLDASASEDRSGTGLTYDWAITDQATGLTTTRSGVTVNFSGVEGQTYDVVLTVFDGIGKSDQAADTFEQPVVGGNPPPTAVIDFTCSATTCSFDGSGSTDDRGPSNLTYSWDFGTGSTPSTSTGAGPVNVSYTASPTPRTITLTVTDSGDLVGNNPRSDTETVQVIASPNAFRVQSIQAVGGPVNGGNWTATITVNLSRTGAGLLESGITVSGQLSGDEVGAASCATKNNSKDSCSFKVQHLTPGKSLTFTLSQVTPASGSSLVYDAAQNRADAITITQGTTVQEPNP